MVVNGPVVLIEWMCVVARMGFNGCMSWPGCWSQRVNEPGCVNVCVWADVHVVVNGCKCLYGFDRVHECGRLDGSAGVHGFGMAWV